MNLNHMNKKNTLSIKILIKVAKYLASFCIICSLSVPLYKHTHLDIDINNKSDRIEWGHLRYQSIYKVDNSYELVVQWVASSGSIVADLVSISLLPLFLFFSIKT